MFDPARDEVATRPYAVRLGLIVLLAVAIGVALMPAVTGYTVGPDGTTACVALRDVWHAAPADVDQPSCLGEARNRLFVSSAGLGTVGIVGLTTVVVGSARRRRLGANANEPASLSTV